MTAWRKGARLLLVAAALVSGGAGLAAAGEARVALVLGNGAYQNAPALPNPPRDAQAIGVALRRLQFQVIEGVDVGREAMVQALRQFGQAADGAELALVFYAGHGIQVDGRNYLLPIDTKLAREQDLQYEAVPVETVLNESRGARRLRLVILDACRDNPFAQRMSRSMGSRSTLVGRGFARIDPGESDTLIAYATKADDVAADGTGLHSPYTTALLQYLETPGLELNLMFGKVRDAVKQLTSERQTPFTYGSLGGEPFYLRSLQPVAAPVAAAPAPAPVAAVAGAAAGADAVELAFWDAIKHSTAPADYRAYLEAYPNGRFAPLARVRSLPAATGAAPPPPAAPAAPLPAPAPAAAPAPAPGWVAQRPPAVEPAPPAEAPAGKPAGPSATRLPGPAGSAGGTGFRYCNQSKYTLETAFGYQDGDDWVSEGWWVLKPGACATVNEEALRYAKYYYYATAQDAEARTKGAFAFCADSKPFTIKGDSQCERRGYREERFSLVEVGEAKGYTFTFTNATLVTGAAAAPGFRFCNKTGKPIETAFGYQEGDDWISEGWWTLKPAECATVMSKPLKYTKYYYYGTTPGGGPGWNGSFAFCVDTKPFTIVGDQNCRERGYRKEQFKSVDVGQRQSYTLDLTTQK